MVCEKSESGKVVHKVGREKWGKEKVGLEKWSEKSGAKRKVGHKVGCEKWGKEKTEVTKVG